MRFLIFHFRGQGGGGELNQIFHKRVDKRVDALFFDPFFVVFIEWLRLALFDEIFYSFSCRNMCDVFSFYNFWIKNRINF